MVVNQSFQIMNTLFTSAFFTHHQTIDAIMTSGHRCLNTYFRQQQYCAQKQRVLRGKINELLFYRYLECHQVNYFYYQTRILYCRDFIYDFVLWDEAKKYVGLELKTSLRDRYRTSLQAGQKIKNLDQKFEFYLLVNDQIEANRLQHKIDHQYVSGIDAVICLTHPSAETFMQRLLKRQFTKVPDINVILHNNQVSFKL